MSQGTTTDETADTYRFLAESSADLISRHSSDGRCLYASPAARALLGYEPAELIGRVVFDLVHPEDRNAAIETLRSALAGQQVSCIKRFRHAAGQYLWLDVRTRSIRVGQGAEVVCTWRDVSEQRRMEAALRESESRLELALRGSGVGLWDWSVATGDVFFNRQWAAMLGYTLDEIAPHRDAWERHVHPEDRPRARAALEAHLAGHTPIYQTEQRLRTKRGDWVWVLDTASVVERGADGRPLRVIGTHLDITDRKRAEGERRLTAVLEAAAREWNATFDAIESPIFVVDRKGLVTRLNRAARDLARLEFRDCIGRELRTLGTGALWSELARLAEAAQSTGASAACNTVDAGRTWDVVASPIREEGRSSPHLIVVARDVSAMVELQASLRHNETMVAMGSIVAGVAHEVRNPLFGLTATLDAFEARFGHQLEYAKYLQLFREQIDRVSALMNELLEYGKPQSAALTPGSLSEVINYAVAACAPLARARGVTIDWPSATLPLVAMDRRRLHQVFQNLIENAVQHSPRSGTVSIDAALASDNAWVACRVLDSGSGIREADLGRLFEPFFSLRRGGTGLGLAIVQRVVREHGGTVTAANRPEGGAVFVVRLPVPPAAAHSAEEPTSRSALSPGA